MHVSRSRRFVVLLAALLVAGAVVSVAVPAVIARQVLGEGTNLRYQFVRQTADASGFDSGWHVHPGLVVFQVEEGSVQVFQGSCTPTTLGPGDTFIEVPWKPVRARATGSVVWTTSLFIAAGDQLSIPLATYSPAQPNPCP
jgi:hypothetical protein